MATDVDRDAAAAETLRGATEAERLRVTMAAMTAHAAFVTRGWGWGPREDVRIPSVEDIERTFWRLITSVVSNRCGSSATGRLYVEAGDGGDLHLSMDLGTLDGFMDDGAPDE